MNTEDKKLADIRQQIDELDYQIHDLLNQRAQLSIEVCKIKYQHDKTLKNFYRPHREAQILEAIKQYNKGPFNHHAIMEIFKAIFQASRKLQEATKHELEQSD